MNTFFRSKCIYTLQKVVSFFLLIVLILISSRYCDLHDYKAYYFSYISETKMEIEYGYIYLAQLFYNSGFPFYIFYTFLMSIVLTLILIFFIENSNRYLLLFLLFVIFPYINELQQLRSAVAASIIIISLRYIINKNTRCYLYILSVVFASFFHFTSITYSIFLIAVYIDYDKLKKITTLIFIFAIPFVSLLKIFIVELSFFLPYVAIKYLKYLQFDSLLSNKALLEWVIFFIIYLIIARIIQSKYKTFSIKTQKLIKITYIILILTLLRNLGNSGYRIALMMYPVFYVTLSRIIDEIENRTYKNLLKSILYIFPITFLCIWWGPLFPEMYDRVCTEMWRVWTYYY